MEVRKEKMIYNFNSYETKGKFKISFDNLTYGYTIREGEKEICLDDEDMKSLSLLFDKMDNDLTDIDKLSLILSILTISKIKNIPSLKIIKKLDII